MPPKTLIPGQASEHLRPFERPSASEHPRAAPVTLGWTGQAAVALYARYAQMLLDWLQYANRGGEQGVRVGVFGGLTVTGWQCLLFVCLFVRIVGCSYDLFH